MSRTIKEHPTDRCCLNLCQDRFDVKFNVPASAASSTTGDVNSQCTNLTKWLNVCSWSRRKNTLSSLHVWDVTGFYHRHRRRRSKKEKERKNFLKVAETRENKKLFSAQKMDKRWTKQVIKKKNRTPSGCCCCCCCCWWSYTYYFKREISNRIIIIVVIVIVIAVVVFKLFW